MVNNPLTECRVQGKDGLARLPRGIGGLVGKARILEAGEGLLKVGNVLASHQRGPMLSLFIRRAVAAENFCLIIYLGQ